MAFKLKKTLNNYPPREVKSFFYTQYFSDGLRNTAGVLLPSLLGTQLGHFATGFILSLGALCMCVVDSPGPVIHKRNGMAIGNLCVFVVALITGFAQLNVFLLGAAITVFCFAFSLLTVYGNRAALVGTASLLAMIFMIGKYTPPSEVLHFSLSLFCGGLWYMAFSLLFFRIRPYRAAQQTLGESIGDIARFLRIKADFYNPDINIDDNYHKLVSQQVKVSEHQDAVREMLFKSRITIKESTHTSRILVLTFVDLVDIFEKIMATHYDYSYIRETFKNGPVLPAINKLLNKMADELDNIGYMVLANTRHQALKNLDSEMENLKQLIDESALNNEGASNLALKKILINLRDIHQRVINIYEYYDSDSSNQMREKSGRLELTKFVSHQDYSPHIFFDNLTLNSSAFKHALRVALVCLVGFIISKFITNGHHSYWILLTIIVILKPGFSLSKQRNYQRLTGTIAGGVIGIIILTFVKSQTALFFILLVFMLITYSFIRLNYIVAVIFMTPFVLIMFKFLGISGYDLVQERVLDTIIGSSIAFIASYFVFPAWEFEQIKENLRQVIFANTTYLVKIADTIAGKETGITDYKLARKEVFVHSANLSAAFQRMTSEPKSKQYHIKDVHRFVVLNHILSSYIAMIAAGIIGKHLRGYRPDVIRSIKKSIAVLNDTNKKLFGPVAEFKIDKQLTEDNATADFPLSADELLLKQQLDFINKISYDIAAASEKIAGE